MRITRESMLLSMCWYFFYLLCYPISSLLWCVWCGVLCVCGVYMCVVCVCVCVWCVYVCVCV
jgi:hypothetical protein